MFERKASDNEGCLWTVSGVAGDNGTVCVQFQVSAGVCGQQVEQVTTRAVLWTVSGVAGDNGTVCGQFQV